MQGDAELRKDLDTLMAITYPGQFDAAWKEMTDRGGQRLRIIEKTNTFNCHAYALGIARLPRAMAESW